MKKKNFIIYLDIIIFGLVVSVFFYDLFTILSNLLENLFNVNDQIICNMSDNSNPTKTTIVHSNEGWAQGIKSIFIYGTGALRISLLRSGGTPLQRGFIIGTTISADAASTALKNAINDPEYVEKHINSWNRIVKGNNNSSLEINVANDGDTNKLANAVSEVKKLLPEDLDLKNLGDNIISGVLDLLKPVLEPVHVDYSAQLLSNQIYGISILLFILSIMIFILLIGFIINLLIFVYSDKLINLFNNKYIKWYIIFNKKIIGIEICFIGSSLIYFMYMLSYGIHFIATHPIIIN
uniref:hypothetical protein n=1 Tax=Elmerina hispida TaxID=1245649 RepID=UPI003001CC14|nr:hypothetical protein [Elmerina hispida]